MKKKNTASLSPDFDCTAVHTQLKSDGAEESDFAWEPFSGFVGCNIMAMKLKS